MKSWINLKQYANADVVWLIWIQMIFLTTQELPITILTADQ
jgi:hypothetical protein